MTKYDEQFKLSVVQQYLDNHGGYKALAKQHRLDHEMVRRWVKWYQAYGVEAFRKKFSHYSAEFKLSVLQHMWDNELSYGQVAVQFDIRSPGALGIWERSYRSGGLEGLQPRSRGRPKAMPGRQQNQKNLPITRRVLATIYWPSLSTCAWRMPT